MRLKTQPLQYFCTDSGIPRRRQQLHLGRLEEQERSWERGLRLRRRHDERQQRRRPRARHHHGVRHPGGDGEPEKVRAGNTKGGSDTVPLTSCLTGLD